MYKTRNGIEIPNEDDDAGTISNAVGTLYKIIVEMNKVLDDLSEKVEELQKLL